jgi:uncharacterized protein YdaU (DUF1376 family)
MAKDPAVLFYTSDFLSGTFSMTNEEVGMYIRLLCLQHQKGKLTEKDMLSICKAYVQDVYDKFELIEGCYVNKRMHDESQKRSNYTNSRRNNAKNKHMVEHMHEHMQQHMPKHMENENENINRIKNKKCIKPTISEVEDYFLEKGSTVEKAKQAFDYYDVADWKDSKGKPVKNWKQKMLAVWINNSNFNNNFKSPKTKIEKYAEWYNKLTANLSSEKDSEVSGFIN